MEKEERADVVLALEGERLPAHRAVVVAGSESQGGGGGAPWGDEGSTGEGVEKGPKRGQKEQGSSSV